MSDIRELTIGSGNEQLLLNSLQIQKKLVKERIKEMNSVMSTIDLTSNVL